MWAAIFGVIASLPKLLDLVEKFASWISKQVNEAKIRQANEDAQKAVDKAKETKDTSDLDKIFDPRKKS